MKLWLALQVLSVCSIVLAASYDESDKTFNPNNEQDLESTILTRVKRHSGKNECSGKLFESVTNCCDIPMLLPLSAMQNCSGGFIQNDRQVVHMLGMPYCSKPNIKKNKRTPSVNATTDTSAIMLSNYKNSTGGRLCVFECLFKGQGLAGTSNDGFDVALVTTKYMAVVSPAWKEIVKTAITSCAAVVKGLNLAAVTPPDGGKKCNPGAALFMSCIYKYNLENCPAAITFTGASCKDDLQKLKNSDVFACLRSGA